MFGLCSPILMERQHILSIQFQWYQGDKILQNLSHVITTHPGILLSPYLLFPSNEKKNWERAIYGNHLPLSYMYSQTL